MGQKVNPIGMRLQVNRTWDSRWFAESKDYGNLLLEDLKMREFIHKVQAGRRQPRHHRASAQEVPRDHPHRASGRHHRQEGRGHRDAAQEADVFTKSELHLNIVEVRKPELDAQLVAESIAQQMERRVSFRRAMKRGVQNAMRMGALGIRVNVGGRLGGAEIARTEWYREGRVPLHTLRADIDYALAEADALRDHRLKVWIFKGEIMEHDPQARDRRLAEAADGPAPRGPRRDAR
jgi:small subunit ribosomal protein S3